MSGRFAAAILCPVFLTIAEGAGRDLYPQIRVVIHEAETAALTVNIPKTRQDIVTWAVRLYARAGYLDDATRLSGKPSDPSGALWSARVLYGDLAGAEKSLESITDPEKRVNANSRLADLLWRMGEPAKARIHFETALKIVPEITNPQHRQRMQASIEQGLKYLTEDPPERLSATPKPRKKFNVQDSTIPLFPITTDGFQDLDSKTIANRAGADGEFMKKLYERMAAGDREGLLRIAEGAASPFQKALGMASIEHILIQGNQPETAEEYAKKIPQVDPATCLAKAEALSAAAGAWLRAGVANRAGMDFEDAIRLVKSVRDLPLGKVSVMVSIAMAQAKGGMVSSCGESLKLANELARELPVRPEFVNGQSGNPGPVMHYRDEAYPKIFLAAIRAHDLGAANQAAELWKLSGGRHDSAIVAAWFDADRTDEAIAFARKIAAAPERANALLGLADRLLDRDGAPNF